MSTWVLLRGLTREARHWGGFPERLQATFPGDRIVTADLPGCGQRHREKSPATVGGMVDALREELADQTHPFRLLGLSLGAMVAIDWATRYPDEVASAAVVNTSLKPFSAFHERLLPRNYATLARLVFRPGPAAAREAAILQLTSALGDADGATLAAWTRIREAAPITRSTAVRQLWAAGRFRAPATAPPVPFLVLASRGDRLVDPGCSEALAKAWNVPLALHESAGHDLPLDAPAWVVDQLVAWQRAGQADLRNCAPAASAIRRPPPI